MHSPAETEVEGRGPSSWVSRGTLPGGEGWAKEKGVACGLGPDVSIFGSVLWSAQRVRPVAQPRVGQLGALTNPDPEALEVASTMCPTDGASPRWMLRVRRHQFSATCTWRGLSWHSGDTRAVLGAGGLRLGVRHQRCGYWKGLASSWDGGRVLSPGTQKGKGTADLGLETCAVSNQAVSLEADSRITAFERSKVHRWERVHAFLSDFRGRCLAGPGGSPTPLECLSVPGVGLQGIHAVVGALSLEACTLPDGFHIPAGSGLVVREVPSGVVSGLK